MESCLLAWLYVRLPAAAFWSDYCFGNSIGRVSPPRLIQHVDSVALLSILHFQVPCIFIVIMELDLVCISSLLRPGQGGGAEEDFGQAPPRRMAQHSTREIFRVAAEHCSV